VCAAVTVAACGKQISPNPPGLGAGGVSPGFMSIKFDVAGQLNFSNYQYWVAFNTSGNGLTPLTNTVQTNWAAYSAAIEVGGNGGATFAGPVQYIKGVNPSAPAFLRIITTPQQFQYVPDSNGSATEFQVTFSRSVFNPISRSPSPSPSPVSNIWLFNAFTTQATSQNELLFIDSMGFGGNTDTSFQSPQLDINTCFDEVFVKSKILRRRAIRRPKSSASK
jgi:hypothetical protein